MIIKKRWVSNVQWHLYDGLPTYYEDRSKRDLKA